MVTPNHGEVGHGEGLGRVASVRMSVHQAVALACLVRVFELLDLQSSLVLPLWASSRCSSSVTKRMFSTIADFSTFLRNSFDSSGRAEVLGAVVSSSLVCDEKLGFSIWSTRWRRLDLRRLDLVPPFFFFRTGLRCLTIWFATASTWLPPLDVQIALTNETRHGPTPTRRRPRSSDPGLGRRELLERRLQRLVADGAEVEQLDVRGK